jgi:antitoxin CptB
MDKNLLLKKTIYKSLHRGCKENDVLIGKFAKTELFNFTENELLIYDNFLEEDDYDIYHWILNDNQPPNKYKNIINKIQKFHSLNL